MIKQKLFLGLATMLLILGGSILVQAKPVQKRVYARHFYLFGDLYTCKPKEPGIEECDPHRLAKDGIITINTNVTDRSPQDILQILTDATYGIVGQPKAKWFNCTKRNEYVYIVSGQEKDGKFQTILAKSSPRTMSWMAIFGLPISEEALDVLCDSEL